MAHKIPGTLSQNYRTIMAEIVDIVEPGLAELTKVWENKLAELSKPMRDEVFGRFCCVYEQTMDSAKGLEKLRENQECDVFQDKFFEVVSDVEASNKILMKFKQNLPTKDILEAIAGLSAKGRERISKELKKKIDDAKNSELEVAFENTFGKMDPWAHRLRHLFVLENIQNENRGISYVEEHLSHLDPTFAKDIRRILKREFHCEPKQATLKQYNDAARTLTQELKNPKKSDYQKTLELLEEIKNNRNGSQLEKLISKLDQPTFEKFKSTLETKYKTTYSESTADYRRESAGALLEELKAAQKSGSEKTKKDPEAELKKAIEDLDAQLAILKQLQGTYSNDVDLINKLRGSLNKENQESYAQHLQVFNSQPDYASISSYKAAVAVYDLLDLSKQVKQEKLNQLKLGKMEEKVEKLKLSVASENTASSSSSTSSAKTSENTSLITPEPEADAKPKFDAVKEIARYDTQIERLLLLIAKKGKDHLIDKNDQVDNKTGDDVDEVLREEFETHYGLAEEEDIVKAAQIVVVKYRFEKQVAILRDIVQTDGNTQLRFNIDATILKDIEGILTSQVSTTYLDSSPAQLAKAAKIYLEKIEAKKVKAKKDFQTSMNTLTTIIGNNGRVEVSDEFPQALIRDLNKILDEKYKIADWTAANGPQTLEAAKILLRKYLMRPNPISKDWHETGIKELKQIIADNGKIKSYPDFFTLKNLDAILMDRYGVVLERYTNDDAKVLAAARTLLRRYEAVQA